MDDWHLVGYNIQRRYPSGNDTLTWIELGTCQVKWSRGMRTIRSVVIAGVTAAILTTGLLLTGSSGRALDGGPDTSQVIREGQVVEITDTTIRIREWAGIYTYRLTPAGRQSLDVNQIRPGDKVQFHAYSVWEVAYDFRKI